MDNDKVRAIHDGVAPIMAGTPSADMLQYVSECLASYVAEYGEPCSIAFVLVGANDAKAHTVAYSWTPNNENSSRLQCCAVASAVLMKRALGL